MEKSTIAKRIHEAAGISESKAATLLDWILEFLTTTLQKGEPIAIQAFGKWTVRSKLPRKGRNPRTGEAMLISARKVVAFRPSAHLKAEVNAVQAEEQEPEGRLPKGK
jgi:integration host factor subunit alpha